MIGFCFAMSKVVLSIKSKLSLSISKLETVGQLTGFQSLSVYTYSGRSPLNGSTTEAKDDVMTTRLTVGPYSLTDFKTSVVPWIAGSRRSFTVS
jgi:hypothetical protein